MNVSERVLYKRVRPSFPPIVFMHFRPNYSVSAHLPPTMTSKSAVVSAMHIRPYPPTILILITRYSPVHRRVLSLTL